MKDKSIVQYTRSTLPKGKTDWDKLKNMSEEAIDKAAKSDQGNLRWTKKMLTHATLCMPQRKVSVHMWVELQKRGKCESEV